MGFKTTCASHIIIILLLAIAHLNLVDAEQVCPNLSPCKCAVFHDSFYVRCDELPMEDIKDIFSKSSPIDMKSLFIVVQPSSDSIPADILGQSRIKGHLYLVGPKKNEDESYYPSLSIDSNAFRSSYDTIGSIIYFNSIDLSQTDFVFLKGLKNSITDLNLVHVKNLDKSLHTLPEMPALTTISITSSPSLREALKSALSVNGLAYFRAGNCDLDKEGLSQVLDWILPSSAMTLKTLEIDGNRLEVIPSQVSSFESLENINVRENKVPLTIKKNSFYVPAGERGEIGSTIYLNDSPLVHIESGAFRGNYGSTIVNLINSSLTRFEEDVFKTVLEDMSIGGNKYFIDVHGNPFDCDTDLCHLAWLLRDNCHLLDFNLKNARCDDGRYFDDLNRNLFAKCP